MTGRLPRLLLVAGLLTAVAVGAGPGLRPAAARGARIGAVAPELTGGPWHNGGPVSLEALRGRVVFVEFWTYG